MVLISLLSCSSLAGNSIVHAQQKPSTNLYGALGLNTIPNARMDETGTVRIGVATNDPYVHSFIGIQVAEPLSVTLRQTGEISSLNEEPDRLYPGLDLKLRLLKENATRPEVSIGLQSAIGHRRTAGEYLALSKRHNNFDFTAGVGWGRYGSAGHFSNPFKIFGNHFGKNRLLDGEDPHEPDDWFTGDKIGLFAGVEYFTPWDGLSLKADYGADRYTAESQAFGFDAGAPWSVGLNYAPNIYGYNGMDVALGMQGTDKVMALLSFDGNVKNWPSAAHKIENPAPFRAYRTGMNLPNQMELKAGSEGIQLYDAASDTTNAQAFLTVQNRTPLPQQLRHAFKHMSNHAGQNVEGLTIHTVRMGLSGPAITVQRRALEKAHAHDNGSASEIWHTTSITPTDKPFYKSSHRPHAFNYGLEDVYLTWDSQGSLSEEDSTGLYRTSVILGTQAPQLFGFLDSFFSLRVNLADNLDRLSDVRPRVPLPVRSDIDLFADRTFAVDEAFSSFTHSFRSDLHLSLSWADIWKNNMPVQAVKFYIALIMHDGQWAQKASSPSNAIRRKPSTSH